MISCNALKCRYWSCKCVSLINYLNLFRAFLLPRTRIVPCTTSLRKENKKIRPEILAHLIGSRFLLRNLQKELGIIFEELGVKVQDSCNPSRNGESKLVYRLGLYFRICTITFFEGFSRWGGGGVTLH